MHGTGTFLVPCTRFPCAGPRLRATGREVGHDGSRPGPPTARIGRMSVDPALAVAVLLTAAVAVVDWVAVARGDRRTRRWAKPGVLVGLLAVALALGAADTTTGRLVLVALALGLVGDVLLLEDTESRFVG